MAANNSINIPPLSSSTSDQTQLVREDEAITRRSANFHPSIWGNFFLSYASPQKEDGGDTQEVKEHQQLKEAVKTMFLETHHPQKLELMINNIQRLGVGYRFEKEIEATLERIYEVYDDLNAKDVMENNDLYAVSLRFRLLRQQGYFVSSNSGILITPTFDEYMKLALRTCGYMMLATTSIVGMPEDFITKEAFDWLTGDPLIVRASTIICRLRDDIVGHKFEQERGHVDSAVESYMKQYGKTEEETVKDQLKEKVSDAWKDISKECLKPFAVFPMPILIRVVNLARVIEMLYDDDGDKYTHSSELKAIITSVLVDPIL